MKATFRVEAMPDDMMVCGIEIPMVPALGTLIKPTPEGDYMEVEAVMWSVADPDRVEVFFTNTDVRESAYFASQGYVIDNSAADGIQLEL